MPKTLLRNVAFASLACVVTFSACQPQSPQETASPELLERNDESLNKDDVTSEVVSTTENSTPSALQSTTTGAPVTASSTAASKRSIGS